MCVQLILRYNEVHMEPIMQTPDKILKVSAAKRYQTVDELLENSKPDQMFYAMLVLSTLIIAGGVILGNTGIIIGGMLVTPMLTQILILALGFTTGQVGLITCLLYTSPSPRDA